MQRERERERKYLKGRERGKGGEKESCRKKTLKLRIVTEGSEQVFRAAKVNDSDIYFFFLVTKMCNLAYMTQKKAYYEDKQFKVIFSSHSSIKVEKIQILNFKIYKF